MSRVTEPPHAPTVWHLGMTKGALIAVAGLTIAVAVGFWKITNLTNENHRLAAQGAEAHRALCVTRNNYRDEIRRSQQYLADVRAGRRQRIPGITDMDIKRQIAARKILVASLVVTKCP